MQLNHCFLFCFLEAQPVDDGPTTSTEVVEKEKRARSSSRKRKAAETTGNYLITFIQTFDLHYFVNVLACMFQYTLNNLLNHFFIIYFRSPVCR